MLAYTAGEHFFPVDAEDYVRCCGLWRGEEELVPAAGLTIGHLAEMAGRYPGDRLSLLLVHEPFDRREATRGSP